MHSNYLTIMDKRKQRIVAQIIIIIAAFLRSVVKQHKILVDRLVTRDI